MVKKIRMAFFMEISEFATMVGLTKQAIYQYEKGMRKPRLPSVKKFLDLAKKKKIQASVEDFLD